MKHFSWKIIFDKIQIFLSEFYKTAKIKSSADGKSLRNLYFWMKTKSCFIFIDSRCLQISRILNSSGASPNVSKSGRETTTTVRHWYPSGCEIRSQCLIMKGTWHVVDDSLATWHFSYLNIVLIDRVYRWLDLHKNEIDKRNERNETEQIYAIPNKCDIMFLPNQQIFHRKLKIQSRWNVPS